MSRKPLVLVVCIAMDEATRARRNIVTSGDPAGFRKVLMLAQALRTAGVRPLILSLGRGTARGPWWLFPRAVKRLGGIPVVYGPFSRVPGLSQLLSFFAFVDILWRLSGRERKSAVFYNRMTAHLLTLVAAAALGYRNVLDFEDAAFVAEKRFHSLRQWLGRATVWCYERLCRGGAILACDALGQRTRIRPMTAYYGIVPEFPGALQRKREPAPPLRVLLSGSLAGETGADLLVEAIRIMRAQGEAWTQDLGFEVTGQGPAEAALRALEAEPGHPRLAVRGRLPDAQYQAVLGRCQVGLSLKRVAGPLAGTTFPSKVIEYAGAGLLVLATDMSDVRKVLGDEGAFFLEQDDPKELVGLFRRISASWEEAAARALAGRRNALARCAAGPEGGRLAAFIVGEGLLKRGGEAAAPRSLS